MNESRTRRQEVTVRDDVAAVVDKRSAVLNRILAVQCYSMVNYVSESAPWLHAGNEQLMEAIYDIVDDHQYFTQRLADAIDDGGGYVGAGSFPMGFASLNDLGLDYLLGRLVEDQHRAIQVVEECVAELGNDTLAGRLANEVLGSERAHLDILNEFLPQTGPVNGSRCHSQVI